MARIGSVSRMLSDRSQGKGVNVEAAERLRFLADVIELGIDLPGEVTLEWWHEPDTRYSRLRIKAVVSISDKMLMRCV